MRGGGSWSPRIRERGHSPPEAPQERSPGGWRRHRQGPLGQPQGSEPPPDEATSWSACRALERHPTPHRQAEAVRLSVVSSEAIHTAQGPHESGGTRAGCAGARRAAWGLPGHGLPGTGPQQQL